MRIEPRTNTKGCNSIFLVFIFFVFFVFLVSLKAEAQGNGAWRGLNWGMDCNQLNDNYRGEEEILKANPTPKGDILTLSELYTPQYKIEEYPLLGYNFIVDIYCDSSNELWKIAIVSTGDFFPVDHIALINAIFDALDDRYGTHNRSDTYRWVLPTTKIEVIIPSSYYPDRVSKYPLLIVYTPNRRNTLLDKF